MLVIGRLHKRALSVSLGKRNSVPLLCFSVCWHSGPNLSQVCFLHICLLGGGELQMMWDSLSWKGREKMGGV